MLFNSYEYLLAFLPATLIGYFVLQHFGSIAGAKVWLVAASLVFYSWWAVAYLPLILASIVVNYCIGTALGYSHLRYRKPLLVAGLTFNLVLLGYFKYANFLIDNLNAAGANLQLARIALPLAISFFTFQKIAYLVDSYRGQAVGYNFLDYALFVTFFPQLIAGPIVHHKEIVPQFADQCNRLVAPDRIATGLCILGIGLFKKVIIADTLAGWATPGFDSVTSLSFVEAWVTCLSYTFQLYFDFSGYTDMAIGAALMFNIRLPINFDAPYRATDIQNFWRRWHITLSNFLRDYLYFPLGGSRHGETRTYANLVIVFLLGGLWHGASWMFVIWGALHGAALVVHRMWNRAGFSMPSWLAWLITFNFVNVAWVFFRAKDISSAAKVLGGMADVRSVVLMMPPAAPWLALASAIMILGEPTVAFFERPRSTSALALSGLAFGLCLAVMFMETSRVSEFLYFNF